MEEYKIFFEPLPGDFVWTLAGGTRQAVKLARPWQQPLEKLAEATRTNCPFCKKKEENINLPGIPDGWVLKPNIFTPHRKHRLIVPSECWPAEKLQCLGGEEEIVKALEICRLATVNDNMEIALVTHIGWHTGQNLGHLHWHICDAQVRQPFVNRISAFNSDRIVARFEEFTLLAGGEKPGQVQILPNGEGKYMDFNSGTIPWLARAIHWIVELGNKKFVSSDQGLPPEFAITVRISADHVLRYASYCPQLAMVSPAFHHTVAAFEGGPSPMPWTHETTAAYLRES